MMIYLMRHGETDWNKERRFQGLADIPLNAFGVELAEKTAVGLKDIPFEAAFCSPLQRARRTAEIVLGDRKVALQEDKRLVELDFGPSDGQCFVPVRNQPEHPLYDLFVNPGHFAPTDGSESLVQARARATAFLEEELRPLEGKCENVLVVAHGAFNRMILSVLENIPDENYWHIDLANCAVSIIELKDGAFTVIEESRTYYGKPVNGLADSLKED